MLRSLRQHWPALVGVCVLATMIGLAVMAPWLAPHDPERVNILRRLKPPAWMNGGLPGHLLGTDHIGRDILSRLLYGARVSLFVGACSVLIGGLVGTLLGVLAGASGGWFELLVMRLVDIQLAFPAVLLAIAVMAVVGSSVVNVVLVLSLTSWMTYCRIAHGQALALREREFIQAARIVGCGPVRIVFRHMLPNVLSPLIVVASFGVAANIINEASLSFLGVGVPPTVPTWGGMLGEGRDYLRIAWWLTTFPGLALMLTVLGVNVVGDWLRDYLDPRLKTD